MGLWTRKSIADLIETEEGGPSLHRSLGITDLILLGIGGVIGAGLFSITGIAAAENAGPAIVIAFIIAAIGCAFAGLCYSELASLIPVAGSAYTYTFATLGEFMAWMIGWNLILEYALGAAAVSISWSGYLLSLLGDWGFPISAKWAASPWQKILLEDGTITQGLINLPAVAIVMLISGILIVGIRQSSRFNALMVFIKVFIVLLFISLGAFYIQPENYTPFLPPNTGDFGSYGWSGVLRASGVVFFAYIGFDAVSTAAQEAKHPQRSVPWGILGSLVICTLLYVLFSFVMTGLVNYKYLNVAAPVALAINQTPFPWLQILVKIAILAGLTSVILVMLLGQSRIFYAMSRDQLLPSFFSAIHPKYHTPWISNLILMIFTGLIGGFVPLSIVGHMTSIGTLLAFAIVCAGVLILRYKEPHMHRPFRTPWVPFVPLMGIGVCGTMMLSLSLQTWVRLLIWLAVGFAIYYFRRIRKYNQS